MHSRSRSRSFLTITAVSLIPCYTICRKTSQADEVTLGERQMRIHLPNVEQLSQLLPNNWDNCSTWGKRSPAARLTAV